MMDPVLDATEVTAGFHPAGYRIDKTASPMNRYTKWEVISGKGWCNPEPVCFDSLPRKGWIAKDKFDWNKVSMTMEQV
jgi:hypothetical protein